MARAAEEKGKLRIGDDWNAIRIIALSQSNPLKAIAELVENSIDAHAKTIAITRGREHGEHYLTVKDDGDGVPRDPNGLPDFKYVATHICDSVKRRLKADGAAGSLQGEFGIGLLSFWTVGETLAMTSSGADQRVYRMVMKKGDPRYTVNLRRTLFAERGTEVKISPLLEGIRSLSGEKIQWYLASELRDRIRNTQVRVKVIDKLARKQYEVEPRQFGGRLLIRSKLSRAVEVDSSKWRTLKRLKGNSLMIFRATPVICILLVAQAMTTTLLFSQGQAGGLRGTLSDPTGAAVPDAIVSAINVSSGVATTSVSTSAGVYNLA